MINSLTNDNKNLVRRFNDELISKGQRAAFSDIVATDFFDHTAPAPNTGAGALEYFIFDLLRVAIPDIHVAIQDLIAEGDRVVTRKIFHGTFKADLLGLAATHKPIAIEVMDILVVREGKLAEHWGMNNFVQAAQQAAT